MSLKFPISLVGKRGATDFGLASRAFVRASTEYIDIDAARTFSAYPFTFCAWIKTDNLTLAAQAIVCVGGIEARKFSIEVDNASVRIRAQETAFEVFSGGTVTTGWHHVAGEFKSATERVLWLDGTSVGTDTGTSVPLPILNALRIGQQIDSSPANYFSGKIADVRIYDAAIGETVIDSIIAGNDETTNLVARYLGNDDITGLVDDLSGNGRDGTNVGSTYDTDGPLD